ncbi:MAG: copper-binding protein [Rhodococcus sp.]|nr:copper-binding protein [Rhodococcus sp. (in: high G+C Gram-positive bacteria)]
MTTPSRTRTLTSVAALSLTLAVTTLSGCADQQTEPETTATGPVVEVAGMAFSPSTLTVEAGTTVTWEFNDGAVTHNVQSVDGEESVLRSPWMKTGTYTFTFDEPGTYDYTCELHPDMRGTIVVQ